MHYFRVIMRKLNKASSNCTIFGSLINKVDIMFSWGKKSKAVTAAHSSVELIACSEFINTLKNMDVAKLSGDPLIQAILTKIKLKASMPFCAEQVISILTEMLMLKHKYGVKDIPLLKLDEPSTTFVMLNAILPLVDRECEFEDSSEFRTKLEACINAFSLAGGEEKTFSQALATLREEYLYVIDMDLVMQAADHAQKSKETANKNAILVIGMTGAGKSYLINHLCAEEIFIGSWFSSAVTIGKQPEFLQHIKIGPGSSSETYKMGVVDIAKSKSVWMSKFSKDNLIVCDTPGAEDTRDLPEFKLVNTLETITPMYRTNSVRFLIVLSSKATSMRGEEFKKTIRFVAKMFDSPAAVKEAAKSMLFVINGADAPLDLKEFNDQLNDFFIKRVSSGFSENDIALIQVLQTKFAAKEVQTVCPGKAHSVKSEALMTKIHACAPSLPTVLTPFAEQTVKDKLKIEQVRLTDSITRIFTSLEADITQDVLQNQVQILAAKLSKLSFMCEYYQIDQSIMVQYFNKLADVMNRFQTHAATTLCPATGGIDHEVAPQGIECLKRLRQLDTTVRIMIQGLLAHNREHVALLIKAFDKKAVPPADYLTMDDKEWNQWVERYRPPSGTKAIENDIQRYQISLTKRLRGLTQAQISQLHAEQVQSMIDLQAPNTEAIPFALAASVDVENPAYKQFLLANLSEDLEQNSVTDLVTGLREYAGAMNAIVQKEVQTYAPGSTIEQSLSDVVRSLLIHDRHHEELLVGSDSAAVKPPVAAVSSSSSSTSASSSASSTAVASAPKIDAGAEELPLPS